MHTPPIQSPSMLVASSIVQGHKADPQLAIKAVQLAMDKIGLTTCNSVLLILSADFAQAPQPAIKAVAKAANCLQVIGCTAMGIFTEDDWVLDAPAVAVMVFGGDIHFQTACAETSAFKQALFTMTAPNAINSTWLNDGKRRYGGVSGDALGLGAYSVWQNAKGEAKGLIEGFFTGLQNNFAASHGLQHLGQPLRINQADGFDVLTLQRDTSHVSAYTHLSKVWQLSHPEAASIPLHHVMALYADHLTAFEAGDFAHTNVISMDENTQRVTLAHALHAGQVLAWAIRSPQLAVAELQVMCDQMQKAPHSTPIFGLLFSSLGRGPYFYDGPDYDLSTIKAAFPGMPLIGFYGNGQIASVHGQNQLLTHSAVLSVFSHTP